ncbi:MAG: hypothetical protein JWO54_313 [Candidatus Saccharibacteria bacterium]|nr:hypothetical protein [Candidatus Saccharibacteria bacterium]
MLKKCYGLFLGLVVLAGSACVTPTYASSAAIIITNVRAGSQASAQEEGIVLYNNASFEVDITNWCLINKLLTQFACFTPRTQYDTSIIPAYSYAIAVSSKAIHNNNENSFSLIYDSSAGSSGTIVASADTISLLDATGRYVDQFTWSSSISSAQQWARTKLSTLPDLFIDTDSSIDWQKVAFSEFPLTQLQHREAPHDVPSEEPEDPIDEPDPTVEVSIPLPPIITELLPNAVGSDTGNEFIEILNPNEQAVISLKNYQLKVGASLEKTIILADYILQPGEYKVFSNAELGYSLLNTSSRASLFTPGGVLVSDVPAYNSPADGESWALIDDLWRYTNQPTPGFDNLASNEESEEADDETATAATLKACAANQYRSLETNRCRLLSSTTSSKPAACKPGQERNLETNRCKAVATTTGCKEGQEKNPETNRCRNIKQLSTASYGVKGATTKQQGGMGWYMWAAIAGVVLLIVGYGIWEWRVELKQLFQAVKAKFAAKPN